MKFFVLIVFAFLFAVNANARTAQELFQQGGIHYEQNDCPTAIKYYSAAMPGRLSQEDRDVATFRLGYCYFERGDNEKAIEYFGSLLQRSPDEDEARLKYAEALLNLERYKDSAKAAMKVQDEDFLPQARVLAARALIEMQRADKALQVLETIPKAQDSSVTPVVEYWKGMAYFQMFDESSAEAAFKQSLQNSPKEYWTQTAARNWLMTVEDAKSPVHARVGFTYGTDDNVAQESYRSAPGGSLDSSYGIKDTYKAYDLYIASHPFHSDRVTMVPSISGYSQLYDKSSDSSYDPTYITADFTTTYAESYYWTYRLSLSYTDSLYDGRFYQDILGANLIFLYGISKSSSAHFGFSYSKNMGAYSGATMMPNLGAEGDLSWAYWLASASYTQKSGDKAVVIPEGPNLGTVESGTLFNSDSALGARVGLGHTFESGFDLLAQLSWAQTTYGSQELPPGVAYSPDTRKDSNTSMQLSLSKSLIERRMTATASYSYTTNTSKGFQGLAYSGGGSPDYNYNRSLMTINLSYGF